MVLIVKKHKNLVTKTETEFGESIGNPNLIQNSTISNFPDFDDIWRALFLLLSMDLRFAPFSQSNLNISMSIWAANRSGDL